MAFENQSMFRPMLMAFRLHLVPHRHIILLVAIIAVLAIRPLIGDTGASTAVFSLSMIALLLVALYNINVDELVGERGHLLTQSERRRRIGWVLTAAAASDRIAVMFSHAKTLSLAGLICWFLSFLFVTLSELRSLLKQREVTGETISMAISFYLLMGLSWAILFYGYATTTSEMLGRSGRAEIW
jgi:hypothetical protein